MRELGFDSHRDTLGRWMAHHVAELIDKSKKGSTAVKRAKARKIATETILKIWQHRASLPGEVYPLARYKEVLKILALLRPDNNRLQYFGHRPDTKRDQLAADLFDSLSRLIIALLLMKVTSGSRSEVVNSAATKALSETERRVLLGLQRWHEIFIPPPKSSVRTRKSQRERGAKVQLDDAALRLIDAIANTLVKLRNELHGVSLS